ncbi:MAG: phosphoribosylglycinamide formyltransferase [Clostridiales bacterium]|nr:phosphoribosylglycinamide formyltransferase [Clostridiales bacterium]
MLKDKTKIAVFVSGGGTNLQAILESERRGEIPDGEIKLVLSNNPSAYALERAKNFGVKSVCVDKSVYKTIEEREEKTIEVLKENGIELIVLAGYLSILSEKFTKLYENRIINVHPSLIPSFCGKGYYGLKVHEEALRYGVKVTGATVHYVNEIPDGGQIIEQKAVYVQEGDTPEILQKRVMREAEWIILPKAVQEVSKKIRQI